MTQTEQFVIALVTAVTALLAVVVPLAIAVLNKLNQADKDRVHVSDQIANTSAQLVELANGKSTNPASLSAPPSPTIADLRTAENDGPPAPPIVGAIVANKKDKP